MRGRREKLGLLVQTPSRTGEASLRLELMGVGVKVKRHVRSKERGGRGEGTTKVLSSVVHQSYSRF